MNNPYPYPYPHPIQDLRPNLKMKWLDNMQAAIIFFRDYEIAQIRIVDSPTCQWSLRWDKTNEHLSSQEADTFAKAVALMLTQWENHQAELEERNQRRQARRDEALVFFAQLQKAAATTTPEQQTAA